MTPHPKNPIHPPGPLTRASDDVVQVQPTLWRIHGTLGPHALPWNGFRTFGPLPTARFDPHPPPRAEHPGFGVSYAALDVRTAIAEAYQASRAVACTHTVALTAWRPVRLLRLLGLTADWALRNSASHALYAAPRRTCRAWSGAIHRTWPDLDGLWSASTVTGLPMVTLYERAADAYPRLPAFSRPVDNAAVWTVVAGCAVSVGYRTI